MSPAQCASRCAFIVKGSQKDTLHTKRNRSANHLARIHVRPCGGWRTTFLHYWRTNKLLLHLPRVPVQLATGNTTGMVNWWPPYAKDRMPTCEVQSVLKIQAAGKAGSTLGLPTYRIRNSKLPLWWSIHNRLNTQEWLKCSCLQATCTAAQNNIPSTTAQPT
jgi:hypothetical protein